MTAVLDLASNEILRHLGQQCGAQRAYVFHFRGGYMSNTHEWAASDTKPFVDKLSLMDTSDLPFFVSRLRGEQQPVVLNTPEELDEKVAPLERSEMSTEDIQKLCLVAVPAAGLKGSSTIGGFIGVDYCTRQSNNQLWDAAEKQKLVNLLKDYGEFLFKVQVLYEYSTGVSPVPFERKGSVHAKEGTIVPVVVRKPSRFNVERMVSRLVNEIQSDHARLFSRFTPQCMAAVPPKVPKLLLNRDSLTEPQLAAQAHFSEHRYAVLKPDVFLSEEHGPEQFADLRSTLLQNLHTMEPDIAPYTEFRNVGYARYRYRNGQIQALKHKGFFQIDPMVNVLLNQKERPFSRLSDDVRLNTTLSHMLTVLLERVWDSELGQDVHINVHPVRVRNFHEGKILARSHATLEGTHTDSTMRACVVMLGRHNVKEGTAKTSLYQQSAPMGLRRDKPEDEAILGPLRLAEVSLTDPFDAITFEDPKFKHDASDPKPEDPTKEMWRCVVLIMCRTPCQKPSPIDGRAIDGFTPRSSRPSPHM